MTTRPVLESLIERVGEGTGPDRELDYALEEMAFPFLVAENYLRVSGDHGWFSASPAIPGANKIAPAAAYTSSIDCALALVRRCLPDANCIGLDSSPNETTACVSRNNVSSGHWYFEAAARTAPLAILAALLTALLSREATPCLEEVVKGATEGEWSVDGFNLGGVIARLPGKTHVTDWRHIAVCQNENPNWRNDASFIAASREALPRLIERIAELEKALEPFAALARKPDGRPSIIEGLEGANGTGELALRSPWSGYEFALYVADFEAAAGALSKEPK